MKGMLNTIRRYKSPSYTKLNEQQVGPTPQPNPNPQPQDGGMGQEEKNDFTIVNNVEVSINSTDQQDIVLKDEEKTKLSQLIDGFRSEVSELADLGKLIIYNDSAKLDGQIKDKNINFTLSAGDDNGVFLAGSSMLKLDDDVMEMLNKLKTFGDKFTTTLNEIILTRKQN